MNRGRFSLMAGWFVLGVADACDGTSESTGRPNEVSPIPVKNTGADQALCDAVL